MNLFAPTAFGPETRLWIFPLETALSAEGEKAARDELAAFVSAWKAHGAPVRGGADVVYGRFVVLGADPAACDVSGCSIDTMFRAASAAAAKGGSSVADFSKVLYRSGTSEIDCVSREEFRERSKAGSISSDTPVFDNTVQTLGDFTERWELPLRASWHRRLVDQA